MRRFNAILLVAIFVTFIIHTVMGAMETLAGVYMPMVKVFARIAFILVFVHGAISLFLVIRSKRGTKTGKHLRFNVLYIMRIVTGCIVLGMLIWHSSAFFVNNVPVAWDLIKVIEMGVFAVVLFFHTATGFESFCMSLGIPVAKPVKVGVYLIAVAGCGVVIYTFYCWWHLITAMMGA